MPIRPIKTRKLADPNEVYARIQANTARMGQCLVWRGAIKDNGYGVIRVAVIEPDGRRRRVTIAVHRVAHYLHTGRWPEITRHTCDHRPCCDFNHLEDGTQADNLADMARRNRSTRGERSATAKLTQARADAIYADPAPRKDIATRYGVSRQTVDRIKNRAARGGWHKES